MSFSSAPFFDVSILVITGRHKNSISLRIDSVAHKYSATKLVTNVKDKCKYVTHYRNLQTYLQAGIELIKIHRVIKFRQKRYIKPYIDKCTKKRQETKSHLKKNDF